MFGCTGLLAEPGILRTRAGVRRLWLVDAARFNSDATGQGLRLRRRRRLSPPAPGPGRTRGWPGAV